MSAQLQTQERRAYGQFRRPVTLTPEQRDTMHEQLYLLDCIKNEVIAAQSSPKPILEVLTILEMHERRIRSCY